MQIQRTMEIDTLEQMCELMCGSVEEDECVWRTEDCERYDCCECSLNEEEERE